MNRAYRTNNQSAHCFVILRAICAQPGVPPLLLEESRNTGISLLTGW
jgi:hypothetical protein